MCLKNVFTYTLQCNELNAKCFETYITSFMKMKDTKDNLSNIRTGVQQVTCIVDRVASYASSEMQVNCFVCALLACCIKINFMPKCHAKTSSLKP